VSAVGGKPVEARVELGRCRYCGAWVRGAWVEDLTAHVAIVEHCPDPEPPEE
jgi:hypothetical protein